MSCTIREERTEGGVIVKVMREVSGMKSQVILIVISLAVLLAGGYFYYTNIPQDSELIVPPVVKDISNNQVRIVWETTEPVIGALYYMEEGGIRETELKEDEKKTYHGILLNNLQRDTIYNYRLSNSSDVYYSFKTPPVEKAFRLLVFQRDDFLGASWVDKFIETANTQLPEFAVVAGKSTGDYIEKERKFLQELSKNTLGLPVYVIPDSETLGSAENMERFTSHKKNGTDYYFDFGNSRFIVLGPEVINETASINDRIEWLEEVVTSSGSSLKHQFVLLAHYNMNQNINQEETLISFLDSMVADEKITGIFNMNDSSDTELTSNEKIYRIKNNFMVIDIDGEGVTGQTGSYQSSEMNELVIKDFPEAVKRSCVYCRKLLEAEKYEESIQWYRDFIDDFGEEYMVDDSQFEIANIYDRYLYNYGKAIEEYKILLNNYPESRKIRQVKHRIEYLEDHSDYNYKPLEIFDKAKMETYQQDKTKAIQGVESILEEYPGSSLEPQILNWLGMTFSEEDLEKSSFYLKSVIDGDYEEEYKTDALIALGDTLYAHMKYEEAIETYQKAENDEISSSLEGKLYRSTRNMGRESLKKLSIAIIIIFFALAIFVKPRLFKKGEVKLAGILALIYFLIGLICWRISYTNYPTLIMFILALSVTGAMVPMVMSAIKRKIFKGLSTLWERVIVVLLTILFSFSIIYMVIYIYRVHYLVAFRL